MEGQLLSTRSGGGERRPVLRWLQLAVLLSSYLTLGMALAIVGPTILDLSQQTNSSLSDVSTVLSARSAGYIIGSAAMGYAYPKVNFQLTSGSELLISAIATTVIPLLTNVWLLRAVFLGSGVLQASFETAGYTFAVQTWGPKSAGPVMQAMTFMFTSGGLISPLMAMPFLSDGSDPHHLRLHYPYGTLAVLFLFNAVMFAVLWLLSARGRSHDSNDGNSNENNSNNQVTGKKWVIAVLCVLSFAFCFNSLEMIMASFAATFAVRRPVHLTKETGAVITSAFWAAVTLPKVPAVFLLPVIGNKLLLISSLIVTVIGAVVLTAGGSQDDTCLWVGVLMTGIGLSAIWGSMFAFVDQVMDLSSRMSSGMLMAAMTGDFVFPFLLSLTMEGEVRSFLWSLLFSASAMSLSFIGLLIAVRQPETKDSEQTCDSVQ